MYKHSDWHGPRQRRFRWSKLRREWGCRRYVGDCSGSGLPLASWWEWESDGLGDFNFPAEAIIQTESAEPSPKDEP